MVEKFGIKGSNINALVENFTVGNDREIGLAVGKIRYHRFDGAYQNVGKIGLLEIEEEQQLQGALQYILEEVEKGNLPSR